MKRKRVSIYDPFKEDIEKWCKAGIPIREMVNYLGEGYTMQGIYAYIYKHGLRTKQAVYDARNKCSECEYFHEYINTNNRKGLICTKTWRTVRSEVKHRPMWCEKEVVK